MKYALLFSLLFSTPGCGLLTDSGTEVEYDPETHKFGFKRSWLGGPFYIEAEATLPDGTHLRVHCESDNNLDAAGKARAGDQAVLQTAIETIQTLAVPVP